MDERKIKVNKDRCPQNHACPLIGVCPVGAISQQGFNAPEVDQEKCIVCGLCTNNCAYKAFDFDS